MNLIRRIMQWLARDGCTECGRPIPKYRPYDLPDDVCCLECMELRDARQW